jgi:glycine/D-amino acid oxidase-like deaminating enzyme
MRVAVVGAGIVGSCVGWHLARRGAQVLLIDAGEPGAGVTNWTFSWVNASNKTRTREYFDLNAAGIAAYRELVADLGSDGWWHPTGHLRWADTPVEAQLLRDAVGHLRSWGYNVDIWEAGRAGRLLEPAIRFPGSDTEVAFYRDEGWIAGRDLVSRLVNDAVRIGAEAHFGTPVTSIVMRDGHVREVVLSGGEHYVVDAVVNAAGPAAREVASLVGRTLPMLDEPGFVARVRCDRVPIRRVMHPPHVELRPDGGDHVVLHSREVDALIATGVDEADLADGLRRFAVEAVPELSTAVLVDARVAWRPIPGDGFPSVGAVDGVAGYYEAVTHSGITLGAITGRVLAQEIMDGTVDRLMLPYRPGRFADS